MKNLILISFFLFSSSLQAAPRIFFKKGDILDLQVMQLTGQSVSSEAYQEFIQAIPKFQSEWDKYAAKEILETSEQIIGKKFKRKEFTSWLILAPLVPMGRPLIMNASPYLEKTPKLGPKLSMEAFIALNHHEVLHLLLEDFEGEWLFTNSKLARKYKKENPNVIMHLHLMAVQKATYQKMGADAEELLKQAEFIYLNVIKGDYARAWEIVKLEGVHAFIKELTQRS